VTTNKEQQVVDMLAREEIRTLPILYCHYARSGNITDMLEIFSDDAEVIMPAEAAMGKLDGAVTKGRDQLAKLLGNVGANLRPWPFAHNHVVQLTSPDTATGWVYSEVRYEHEAMRTCLIMVYEDGYVKERGKWKIARRKLNPIPIPK